MQWVCRFVVLNLLVRQGNSFVPSLGDPRSAVTTELQATRRDNVVVGAATSLVAGWMMASQVAFADPTSIQTPPQMDPITRQAPTVATSVGFGNVETLDFSMPSYGDATASPSKKTSAPNFNPFGDFEPAVVGGSDSTKPAAEKAPPKEAPSSAPDAPEFQLPKMKVPDFKMPSFSAPAMPDMPEMKVPAFKSPDIKIPEFNAPDIKIPEFKAPDFKFSMPKMEMPGGGDMALPKVDMPKMDMPDVKMPKMDMPKMDMPDVKMPNIDLPKLPALPNPFGSSEKSPQDKALLSTPQEVRDEKAREARLVFVAADEQAKEAEAAAKAVRQAANQKKKAAEQAKDLACETRPGGKLLCVRNPFNAGF